MIGIFGVVLVLAVVVYLAYWRSKKNTQNSPNGWFPILLVTFLASASLTIYHYIGQPDWQQKQASTQNSRQQHSDPQSNQQGLIQTGSQVNQQQIEAMQALVMKDKQKGESWYALGNAYMYANQFENAATAFSYAERLAKEPQANIYSAHATALYYENNQRITPQTQALLDKALAVDKDNVPTLMLLASDHFLNAEYQDAIDLWQHALDTNHDDVDRVTIIKAINQAKELMH
ncbi:TPR domain-containing protein [Vibrio algicola]|uniref:Nitrite reductase n=1 Tax=Vibrio algicola TaxID=2662262 RepID=A0A5Q0TDX8_9VIBR|nr:nitrite reductase [Vibrio algicola]